MATYEPMSRNIVFRADGNAQIGMGHLMRCLALAEMLGSSYDRRLAIAQPAPEVFKLIEEKGVAVIQLQTNEAAEFLDQVDGADVVVLDGYTFDIDFQRAVRARAEALVYIDDLVRGHQVADVVVNHAGGLTDLDYQSEPYTQFLLGPRYALLRPEFFAPATPVPSEGSIFVSLGGADPSNTAVRVLESLRTCFRLLNQAWRVHIVIGPVQQNRLAIEAMQSELKHLTILTNLSARQLVVELTKCQLAITACSTVAYEVCAIGRPLIAIQTADNQTRLATFLADKSLADVLPGGASVHDMARAFHLGLGRETRGLWSLFVQNQRRFFDGQSPERFRALFERLCS